MKKMPIYLLYEYKKSNDQEKVEKQYALLPELNRVYNRKNSEGLKFEILALWDHTSRDLMLFKFETAEDFDKFWNDEEFSELSNQFARTVDNMTLRILKGEDMRQSWENLQNYLLFFQTILDTVSVKNS